MFLFLPSRPHSTETAEETHSHFLFMCFFPPFFPYTESDQFEKAKHMLGIALASSDASPMPIVVGVPLNALPLPPPHIGRQPPSEYHQSLLLSPSHERQVVHGDIRGVQPFRSGEDSQGKGLQERENDEKKLNGGPNGIIGPTGLAPSPMVLHTLQKDDTMNLLVLRYGSTAECIMKANGMLSRDLELLPVGCLLRIPQVVMGGGAVVESCRTEETEHAKRQRMQKLLIRDFMSEYPNASREEGKFYLEEADWNLAEAKKQFVEDSRWETEALKNLRSQSNPQHGQLQRIPPCGVPKETQEKHAAKSFGSKLKALLFP